MLNTLRKIVQEVNSAKDLKSALGIIVLRVKEAMGSQVCSVYLLCLLYTSDAADE